MPGFDILGTNAYGASPGSFGSGLYQALAAQQGGAGGGQGQNGRVFNSTPLAGQPQQQAQPGAPVSGLVAGALGLPTMAGADPGTAYLVQNQGQQGNGGQGQQQQPQQPQQMSGLMSGILGLPQSGQAAGQQGQMQPNGGQPQNNMGSNFGSLLNGILYSAQSRDV